MRNVIGTGSQPRGVSSDASFASASLIPVVAVEVSPAKAADDRNLLTLLRACSQALPQGACELRAGSESEGPGAVATVHWDADGNANVSVRLRDSEHDLTRALAFGRTDPELQRWRSVGLTIATIVDELEVQREAEHDAAAEPAEAAPVGHADAAPAPAAPLRHAPAAEPGSEPRSERGRAEPVARRSLSSSQLELGGMGGTGLAGGGLRGGVYARGARDLAGLPAFASVTLAYALSSSEQPPSVTWTELGLGGGFYLLPAPVRLELSAELELVRTSASARAPAGSAIDSGGRWLPAAVLGVHAVWPARGPLAVLLGARGEWSAREVTITNAGQEIGRVPAYSVGAQAGVRFTF